MEIGDINEWITELPNFEDETCLLEAKISKDKSFRSRKNFRMLVTDYNVIFTETEKGYDEHESFLIKELDSIIWSPKEKNELVVNVKGRPSYQLSTKMVKEIVEMFRHLYFNCAKKRLVVYQVPQKGLNNYVTNQEEFADKKFKFPSSEFKEIGAIEAVERGSGSTNDSEQESQPKDRIEGGSKSSEEKFDVEEKNVEVGNKIIEQLGNGYLEDQQRILSQGKSTLIFNKKTFMKSRKITQDNCYEEWMKLLENYLGINQKEEEQTPEIHKIEEKKNQIEEEEKNVPELDCKEESKSIINSDDSSVVESKSSPQNRESSSTSDSEIMPELCDFVILKMLNKGGFGKVFLVKNTLDNKYYAMKRIRKDLLIETGQIENTINEKTVLLRLQNPFLLGMSYAFQSEFRLYFFMDYISGGDLYDNLVKVKRFTEEQTKFFWSQIVIALGFLHKNKIVHRDLKPENVLLNPDGYVVLADFGLAKIFDDQSEVAKTMWGTPEYMAPEILEGKPQSYTVDWWTLGVLTYELSTGRSPFKHKNDRKLRKLIKKGKFPWPDPEKHKIHLSDELKDFISRLLTPDPTKRLGAKGVEEIISHSWFKSINFEEILQKKIKPSYFPEIPKVIEENTVMIKSHRKFKKKVRKADQQRDELMETCIGRARQRLIRDYQSKFDATFGCQQ